MGLFDKLKEPVFYKTDSTAEMQLTILKSIQKDVIQNQQAELEREMKLIETGIMGEKQIAFELSHSHMPMYVLHDLFLTYGDLTAQIDFFLITRYHYFLIECKNLYGDIEIDQYGNFIRNIRYGNQFWKERIYSPVTQSQRHLELVRQIFIDSKKIGLLKIIANKFFPHFFKSIVVLSNPKSVLNADYAPPEIRNQVIHSDKLIEYIRQTDRNNTDMAFTDKDMEEIAKHYLSLHHEPPIDYSQKYAIVPKPYEYSYAKPSQREIICPKCGAKMLLRKAKKGANKGKEFYGCSNYPKCHKIIDIDSPLLKDNYDYYQ